MTRRLISLLAALLIACAGDAAFGQGYPDRALHLIVGAGAGSFPDQVARRVGEQLARQLGQPVVIENHPGAGGLTAMGEFVKARPDGYTIALATMSQLVFNRVLFHDLPYDPDRDLQPVGTLLNGSMMIVANPSFSASSLPELVALARSKPGAIDFAVPATASPPHVVLGMLMDATRTSFSIVPFRTGSDAAMQVSAGQVPLFIDAVPVVAGLVQGGKLKALAVTGKARVSSFPDVPTVAEQGYPSFVGDAWMGVVARSGTPAPVMARLSAALAGALKTDSLRQYIESSGAQVFVTTPDEFSRLVRSEVPRWEKVIRDMRLTLAQ